MHIINFLIDSPSSPVLIYKSTLNEILVSWSPVDSDTMCGPVAYNITVMPSHGMIMMINDTVYNITGLNYNTNYTITVYATNYHTSGEPSTIAVHLPPGMYVAMLQHGMCNLRYCSKATSHSQINDQTTIEIRWSMLHYSRVSSIVDSRTYIPARGM